MANRLPKLIAMKSCFGKYAYYEKDELWHAFVFCGSKSVFNPFTRIEVEPAKSDTHYVHLRFCHSNKYWAWRGPDDHFIYADSDQPEEDKSKLSCTLFEPRVYRDELHLIHIQSGRFLSYKQVHTEVLSPHIYVGDIYYDDGYHVFHFIDLDTLVFIPKHVTFKGDNGKFLKAYQVDEQPYLQCSSDDGNDEYSAYEVQLNPDGHVRIKSQHFGKFWRCGPNWIYSDSSDDSGEDKDTLFWPVKVDNRTVALRCAGNNHFCGRLASSDGKKDCLSATVPSITKEAKLVVEELVLERDIYNVRYRMEDARIFDEKPFVAGIGVAANHSDTDSSLAIKISYEDTRTESFTKGISVMGGIKTTFVTKIPFIFEGKVEFSAQVTGSLQWGETILKKKLAECQYTVRVPAKTRVRVNYVGIEGTCNVPFSYMQRDKSSMDGRFIRSEHVDGVFTGVNYYNFDFVQFPAEPL